jgi:Spy/CpxP family protein refolding chaperone
MKSYSRLATAAALLGVAASSGAQPLFPGPMGRHAPFLGNLFPPEAIMAHQGEIELTAAQRTAIVKAVSEAQTKLLDLRWQSEAEAEKLGKLLAADKIDQAAALAEAQRLMGIEQQLKTAHLTLLIAIKNQLTPGQQAKLRELRARARSARGMRRRGSRPGPPAGEGLDAGPPDGGPEPPDAAPED